MLTFVRKFEKNEVFSEDEAWMLFRLAAVGEAVGWTLLISGILCKRFMLHGNNIPVLVAGQFHGISFLLYALAAVGLYPTLRWSRKRAFVALLASVPPYGSLMFEQWAHHMRRDSQFRTYRCCVALALLSEKI
jgi:integral membrane protein